MVRSRYARVLAVGIGLLASLAAPGLALAHGYAHHELSENAARPVTPSSTPGPAVEDVSHQDRGHAHPSRDIGLCARIDVSWVALISALQPIVIAATPATGGQLLPEPTGSPPASVCAPPPPSRAPPGER